MTVIDDVIEQLRQKKASMRCSDMKSLLESLHFEITDGSTRNHKLVSHDGITGFIGSNYDCGHGNNPQIKSNYVIKMRRLVEKYRSELAAHLGIEND